MKHDIILKNNEEFLIFYFKYYNNYLLNIEFLRILNFLSRFNHPYIAEIDSAGEIKDENSSYILFKNSKYDEDFFTPNEDFLLMFKIECFHKNLNIKLYDYLSFICQNDEYKFFYPALRNTYFFNLDKKTLNKIVDEESLEKIKNENPHYSFDSIKILKENQFDNKIKRNNTSTNVLMSIFKNIDFFENKKCKMKVITMTIHLFDISMSFYEEMNKEIYIAIFFCCLYISNILLVSNNDFYYHEYCDNYNIQKVKNSELIKIQYFIVSRCKFKLIYTTAYQFLSLKKISKRDKFLCLCLYLSKSFVEEYNSYELSKIIIKLIKLEKEHKIENFYDCNITNNQYNEFIDILEFLTSKKSFI